MAKSRNQDLKLLYILEYLTKYSDEEHGVLARDIQAYLSDKHDVQVSIATITRYIKALSDYGFHIEGGYGKPFRMITRGPFSSFKQVDDIVSCIRDSGIPDYTTKYWLEGLRNCVSIRDEYIFP